MFRVELNHWNGSGYSHSETFDNIEENITAEEYVKKLDSPLVPVADAINVEIYNEDNELVSEYWVEK